MAQEKITRFEEMSGFKPTETQQVSNDWIDTIMRKAADYFIGFAQELMKVLWNAILPLACMVTMLALIFDLISFSHIEYFWQELVFLVVVYLMLKGGDNIGHFLDKF